MQIAFRVQIPAVRVILIFVEPWVKAGVESQMRTGNTFQGLSYMSFAHPSYCYIFMD